MAAWRKAAGGGIRRHHHHLNKKIAERQIMA